MRVLVVSAPLLGHMFPLVPLAQALRAAGHEVLVATAGDAVASDIGLPIEDIAPRFNFGRIVGRMMLGHPLVARAELAGRAGTRGVGLLFGAVNAAMADGVVALADRWAPNLVVHEPLAVAGALAAARRGVPAVLQENTLFDGVALVRATAARLGRAMRRHNVPTLPPSEAVITIAPPSMVGARPGWPMCCLPYGGQGDVPPWLLHRAERPRILVSRSTVDGPGAGDLMSRVVAVAEQVDAEFVLVRPDRRVQRRGTLPANVRTVGWIPLPAVLPTCAGIVHHGGSGTVFAALAAGVPQLVANGGGDRTHNARLVAARGAGLAAAARDITATELTRLVSDTALASAAREVGHEIAAMPPPDELAVRLNTLHHQAGR